MIRNLTEIITDGEINTVRHFIYLSWIIFFGAGILVGIYIKGGLV